MPGARLPSLSFLRNRSLPRESHKKVCPVAAIHYRKRSDSFQSRHKAGAGNRRAEWRAADRKCASRCGHSSRRAGGPGVAFVGALCRRIDNQEHKGAIPLCCFHTERSASSADRPLRLAGLRAPRHPRSPSVERGRPGRRPLSFLRDRNPAYSFDGRLYAEISFPHSQRNMRSIRRSFGLATLTISSAFLSHRTQRAPSASSAVL